jgi:hypothetical protein
MRLPSLLVNARPPGPCWAYFQVRYFQAWCEEVEGSEGHAEEETESTGLGEWGGGGATGDDSPSRSPRWAAGAGALGELVRCGPAAFMSRAGSSSLGQG